MPTTYQRPSYIDLRTRIAADMAALPAVLRGPLAAAWAQAAHGEHAHLEWLYDQLTPLACDEDRLQDWATLYSVPRLPAARAGGPVTVSGSAGATLLKDTPARGPNGLDYLVSQAVTLAGTTASAQVTCAATGSDGNLPTGAELTLIDPVMGLSGALVVGAGGLSGGAGEETLESWRARVVDEWRTLTTTGARSGRRVDYVYWARSAHPSVTGALVQMHAMGAGTVVVRPICNGLAGRLPTAGVLSAVAAAIPLAAPVMPDVYVWAPALKPVAMTLDLAAQVDSAETRAAVEAALLQVVLAEQTDGAQLLLSEIDAAVSSVTTQYVRQAPAADVVCGAGEILSTPVVTWV